MSRLRPILPISLFALGVLLSFMFWHALRNQQDAALVLALNEEAGNTARTVQTVMADRLRSLRRMAGRWEAAAPGERESLWRADAKMLLADLHGTQAVEWADAEGVIRWIEPLAGNEAVMGRNVNTEGARRRLVDQARQTRQPVATPLLALKQGGSGFLLFVPLYAGDRYNGMLVAVFRAGDFARGLFPDQAFRNLHVRLSEGGKTVFESAGGQTMKKPVAQAPVRFWGLEWVLSVAPQPGYVAQKRTWLPEAALGVSLLLSFLLAWLVRITQLARHAADGMQEANFALRESLAKVEDVNAELAFREFAIDQAAIVAITDVQGHITYANDKFCEISGYSREEMLGKDHRIVNSGYHPPEFFREMYRTVGRGQVWHGILRNRAKNGEHYWVDATIVPARGKNGKVDRYIAIRFDVTEQKHIEEALRRVTTLQAAILDNAGYSIIATNPDGVITTFNRAAERMLGYSASEMIGLQTPEVFHDQQEMAARAAQLAAETDAPMTKGMALFSEEVSRQLVSEAEWTYIRKDGSRFPVLLSVTALRDAEGALTGMLGIAVDISDRKHAEEELRQHRDHLRDLVKEQTAGILHAKDEAERANHAKSEFLANMSHELRTPMHAILSFSKLGRERVGSLPPERLRDYFDRICTSGERLLGTINDLLDLSKLEAGKMHMERQRLDLARLCQEVLADFEQLAAAKHLLLTLALADCDTYVIADPVRMAQVVRNLVSNAVKFTPEGRSIVVGFSEAEMVLEGNGAVCALCLSVVDEGIGIPEDELDVIFDKFVQSSKTRNGSGGTGLGLAICRDIVEAHQGMIRASHAPSGGARMEVLLPRAADFSI